MALRDHKIMEWTGSPVHGNNRIHCNCGWSHSATTTDAALAAYRLHKSTN